MQCCDATGDFGAIKHIGKVHYLLEELPMSRTAREGMRKHVRTFNTMIENHRREAKTKADV